MEMSKYFELEQPHIIRSMKNVVRIFMDHGKIQVFPRVDNSKYGIGRGATIDLDTMDLQDLVKLQEILNSAVNSQLKRRTGKSEIKY